MSRQKQNGIKISYSEKDIYRIFHELKEYGRTSYHFNEPNKRKNVSLKISSKAEHLIHQGLLYPPVNNHGTIRKNIVPMSFIMIPHHVKIIEVKDKRASVFIFTDK
jgi:hypothetical protein